MKTIAAKADKSGLMIITEGKCPHCGRESILKSSDLFALEKTPFLIFQFEKDCPGCGKKFLIEYYP